jgi:hypothetical protein
MVPIIWRGLGRWVLAVPLLMLFGLFALTVWLPLLPRGGVPMTAIFALSGVVTAAWGFAANRPPWPIVIDPVTGHEFLLRTRHSLYGVPMQYWGLFELAVALAAARS